LVRIPSEGPDAEETVAGFVAYGRGTLAKKVALIDPILGPLTSDRLTRDVEVYQREKGHRFSSDDIVTAYIAANAMPNAQRVLDLGCGLGSVLLHLAWSLPDATLLGIEAQAISFELLRRNLERSGFANRVRIVHGDIRDARVFDNVRPPFDLVTGTPPYFPPSSALNAEDEQRAFARVEYRGGVEAYVDAGLSQLAANGRLVLCADTRSADRVETAARAGSAEVESRCDVIPRAGRPPLFSVWAVAKSHIATQQVATLILRDSEGNQTQAAQRLREFSGF